MKETNPICGNQSDKIGLDYFQLSYWHTCVCTEKQRAARLMQSHPPTDTNQSATYKIKLMKGITIMKKLIIGIACCAFVAPLAFGGGLQMGVVTESGITVKARPPVITVEGGEVASYQPANTLVVHGQGAGQFSLEGPGHVFNGQGERVRGRVTPGARVHVYFAKNGGVRTIDHVVVD
jgi:hypothetical protein